MGKKTVLMTIPVTFDTDHTDADAVSVALDILMTTATSSPGVLDDYGMVGVGEFYPPPSDPWDDDRIQFARLLDEILAVEAISSEAWDALEGSMDLTWEQIESLFSRAGQVWDRAKADMASEVMGIPGDAYHEIQTETTDPVPLTDEEHAVLQEKYAGRSFVFHSPYINADNWRDGDTGTLVQLLRWDEKEGVESNDVWTAVNTRTGGTHQLFGGEAFGKGGEPLIPEHRFVNWKPD